MNKLAYLILIITLTPGLRLPAATTADPTAGLKPKTEFTKSGQRVISHASFSFVVPKDPTFPGAGWAGSRIRYRRFAQSRTNFAWNRTHIVIRQNGCVVLELDDFYPSDTSWGPIPGVWGSKDFTTGRLTPGQLATVEMDVYKGDYTNCVDSVSLVSYWGATPQITRQPQNLSAPLSSAFNLALVATATPSPAYQWFKDGVPLLDLPGLIRGANSSTLRILAAGTTDSGIYYAIVSNRLGQSWSESASVAVLSEPSTPFVETAGTFVGLFGDTNAAQLRESGFVTLSLTKQGAFSGKLTHFGGTLTLSGQFGIDRRALVRVLGNSGQALTILLELHPGEIVGGVSGDSWTAQLIAQRGGYLTGGDTRLRGWFSHQADRTRGAVLNIVVSKGQVSVKGELSDGNALTCSSLVSQNGQWPIYCVLPKGAGVVLGWLQHPGSSTAGLVSGAASTAGDLLWLPSSPTFNGGWVLNGMWVTTP